MNSVQSIHQLPDFSNTGGSGTLATPYGCSADGRYAVGMNYRGVERAVLWDTVDANSANWTVLDLTERATAEGIMGGFQYLTKAYGVGTNAAGNPVITGYGWYFDGTGYYNRAFVMVVSPSCSSVANVGGFSSPVYDNATSVMVTGCSTAASTIKVYHGTTVIGSATGGTATVLVPVSTLTAGWVLAATQTVGGQESCTNSAPTITVTTAGNPAPAVVLTSPANGASYTAPATINLSATVTTNDNTINSVSFYNGSTLIATVTTSPFTYSWATVAAGTYSLTARLTYNSSSTLDSAAAVVTVNGPVISSTLAAIPLAPWTSGEYQSQGRGISQDGAYIVGTCYTSAMGDGDGFLL